MKRFKTIFLLLTVLFFYNCKAQMVLPIEEDYSHYKNQIEVPDGTYFKDLNGVFDKYLGVWHGSKDLLNYELSISKITDTFLNVTTDRLIIKYKVIDSPGNVLINTMNNQDDDLLVIRGNYLLENGETYTLDYNGVEMNCGQSGIIFITVVDNGNKLLMDYIIEGDFDSSSCPNGEAEQIIPLHIELIKQ